MAKNLAFIGILLLCLSSAGSTLAGQAAGYDEKAVANFYRGKTVTISSVIRPAAALTATPERSRAISPSIFPAIRRYLVNNMVGAGTMVSANYTYNQAPKDGTVINSFDGGIVAVAALRIAGRCSSTDKIQLHRRAGYFQIHYGGDQEIGYHQDGRNHVRRGKQVVIGAVPNTSIQHAATFLRDVIGGRVKW